MEGKVKKKLIQQWDEYAELVDECMGEDGDSFHKDIIDPAIIRAIPDGFVDKKVLEAGCGNGHLARFLARKGAKEIVGVDISSKMLEFAKLRSNFPNLQYLQADLMQKLPFDDGEFDLVIGSMLAQYVPSVEKLSENLRRVVKPNGNLILAIDHPTHALFMRTIELMGYKNPKFLDSVSYFDIAYCEKNSLWDQAIIGYYHRPLHNYITPFLERDWSLVYFKEEGRSVKLPLQRPKKEIIPRIVILGFISSS